MKILNQIIAYLFGLIYLVFGLNYFLQILPMPLPEGQALDFMVVMGSSGYLTAVKILEIAAGLLIVLNFWRPLAYLLILPVSVNILMYDVFLLGMPALGAVMVVMNVYLLLINRSRYRIRL